MHREISYHACKKAITNLIVKMKKFNTFHISYTLQNKSLYFLSESLPENYRSCR